MVIQPKIRGFICANAHPVGCAEHVKEQIAYVKQQGPVSGGPKNVLVIGASTGYGLASRITAAFGSGADSSFLTSSSAAGAGDAAAAGFVFLVILEAHEAPPPTGVFFGALNTGCAAFSFCSKILSAADKSGNSS